jgi:hypothetical protein
VLPEIEVWKNAGPFDTNCIELRWIDTKGFEDGWRNLGSFYFGEDCPGLEVDIGDQQHDMSVVMSEAAVLLLL